jgi:hypothetical protein
MVKKLEGVVTYPTLLNPLMTWNLKLVLSAQKALLLLHHSLIWKTVAEILDDKTVKLCVVPHPVDPDPC